MMKDQIKFYDSKKIFVKKCPVCFKQDHAIDQCKLINYHPDRDFIIKKNNFSIFQERSKNIRVVRLKKYNALKNRHLTLSKALKVDFLEDNDSASGISSDENDFLLSDKYHNNTKEKRKKMTFLNSVTYKKEDLTEEQLEYNENVKEKVFLMNFNSKII